jgi:hypothetical protein
VVVGGEVGLVADVGADRFGVGEAGLFGEGPQIFAAGVVDGRCGDDFAGLLDVGQFLGHVPGEGSITDIINAGAN